MRVRKEGLVWYQVRLREGMKFRDGVRVRDAGSTQEYWSVKHMVLHCRLPSVLHTKTTMLNIQRHNPRPQGH